MEKIEETNSTINNPSIGRTEKLLVASFILLLLFSRLHWIESWEEKNVHIFRLMHPKQQRPIAPCPSLSFIAVQLPTFGCEYHVIAVQYVPFRLLFWFQFFQHSIETTLLDVSLSQGERYL